MNPTATKTKYGAWEVLAIIDEHLVTRVYYFTSKREALARFRAEFK